MGSQLVLFCRGFSTPQIFVFVFITIFNCAFPSISSVIVLLTFAQSYVVVVFGKRIPYPSLYFTYFVIIKCLYFIPKEGGKKKRKKRLIRRGELKREGFSFLFFFVF